MTNRIPVGATLAEAGRFVVRDFVNILGVSAPVLVLSWIPTYLAYTPGSLAQGAALRNDPGLVAHMLPIFLLLYPAIFLLMSMQFIGIAQLASCEKASPRYLYLSLRWPVWRMIGSILLLIIVLLLGALAAGAGYGTLVVLVKLGIGANSAGWAIALSGALMLVGGAVIWCALIYCLVRLSFLLIPVIAAQEPGFAIAKSWKLGAGNFWRMFALLLAGWLPLLLLEVVLIASLFAGVTFPPPHASADQTAAFQATMSARFTHLFDNMIAYWYVVLPVFSAVMVLFYGFVIGAQVFAYRALKAGSAPVAGDALPE